MKDLPEKLQKQILSEAAFHEAVFAHAAGNRDRAIECLEHSLKLDPSNKNAEAALKRIHAEK